MNDKNTNSFAIKEALLSELKGIDNAKLSADELKALVAGNAIALVMNEQFINMYELTFVRTLAYEKLFTSYMNSTCEEANQLNLDKFLEKYTQARVEQEYLKKEIIRNALGDQVFEILNKHFAYKVDYEYMNRTVYLAIMKKGEIE